MTDLDLKLRSIKIDRLYHLFLGGLLYLNQILYYEKKYRIAIVLLVLFGSILNNSFCQIVTNGKAPEVVPYVATELPDFYSNGSVRVCASIFPEGTLTAIKFEYGLTLQYGSEVDATPNLSNSNNLILAKAWLKNLLHDTLYYYRVKAYNQFGQMQSSGKAFRTCDYPIPVSGISGIDTFCSTLTVLVTYFVTINNAQKYKWEILYDSVITTIQPFVTVLANKIYNRIIKVTGENNCGAYNTVEKISGIKETPTISFMVDPMPAQGCSPFSIKFTNESTPMDSILKFSWIFDDIDTVKTLHLSYLFKTQGYHSVGVSAEYQGCKSHFEIDNLIYVYPKPERPVLNFNTSTNQFEESTGSEVYWLFNGSLIELNPANHWIPKEESLYQIYAVNSYGCTSDTSNGIYFSSPDMIDYTICPNLISETDPMIKLQRNILNPKDLEVTIINALGTEIVRFRPDVTNVLQFSLHFLERGVCFLKIKDREKIITKKIVKV